MTTPHYLRFPHVHHDLLTFVAEDDVWLADAAGGRAWRLSADDRKATWPRLSRDGAQVAWASLKDGAAEIYLADTDGGASRRLTYWGDPLARVCGWTPAGEGPAGEAAAGEGPAGEVIALTAAGQPFVRQTWAYAISAEAGQPGLRRLSFGPISDLAVEPAAVALLTAGGITDPAWRKRYRGRQVGPDLAADHFARRCSAAPTSHSAACSPIWPGTSPARCWSAEAGVPL